MVFLLHGCFVFLPMVDSMDTVAGDSLGALAGESPDLLGDFFVIGGKSSHLV